VGDLIDHWEWKENIFNACFTFKHDPPISFKFSRLKLRAAPIKLRNLTSTDPLSAFLGRSILAKFNSTFARDVQGTLLIHFEGGGWSIP
jgi:hypothetical protein